MKKKGKRKRERTLHALDGIDLQTSLLASTRFQAEQVGEGGEGRMKGSGLPPALFGRVFAAATAMG